MTFIVCKKAIEVQIKRGTLDKEAMLSKLDVFLLAERITEDEYNALIQLMG